MGRKDPILGRGRPYEGGGGEMLNYTGAGKVKTSGGKSRLRESLLKGKVLRHVNQKQLTFPEDAREGSTRYESSTKLKVPLNRTCLMKKKTVGISALWRSCLGLRRVSRALQQGSMNCVLGK